MYARMKKEYNNNINIEIVRNEFILYQSNCICNWTNIELKVWKNSLIPLILDKLTIIPTLINIPNKLYIICTNGYEDGIPPQLIAAKVRGNDCIILPRNMCYFNKEEQIKTIKLFFHELWHVISRNNTNTFRNDIYKIFGWNQLLNTIDIHSIHSPINNLNLLNNPDAYKLFLIIVTILIIIVIILYLHLSMKKKCISLY